MAFNPIQYVSSEVRIDEAESLLPSYLQLPMERFKMPQLIVYPGNLLASI